MLCTRRPIIAILVAALVSSCQRDAGAPSPGAAARLETVVTLPSSGPVGSTLSGPAAVLVSDEGGRPVSGVAVLFTVTVGNGGVTPRAVLTDAAGHAETRFTLGTIAGGNEVTASVSGIATTLRFSSTGIAGAARSVIIGPRPARFPLGTDSLRVTTTSFDAFGNRTSLGVSVIARDSSLVAVATDGFARVRRRGGTTFLVATTAGSADSVLAVVLAPGDPPCTAIAVGIPLAAGEVVTDVAASGFCARAGASEEEFVLIPHFSVGTPSSTLTLQVLGSGLGVVGDAALTASSNRLGLTHDWAAAADHREQFERALRDAERREMPRFAAGARAWRDSALRIIRANRQPGALVPNAAAVPANVAVGDLVTFNVNALEFCANPRSSAARVVAVSERAVVVADTANPAGGLTSTDYRSIAVTFDTLVSAVDIAAFGEPSDVDANGRIVILFTRAVNELTPRGAPSVVLGFYFSRDLLPTTSDQGNCPGSNVAEMFYLLVPDPDGAASDPRTTSFVLSVSNGTIAHEFQHLINASRRLYVNHAANLSEETWLNEGLSHIAEELVFYRASRLAPRQNFGAELLAGSGAAAFQEFQLNNLRRYAAYLRSTATQSPVGLPGDDDVETRGATWSFLRYAADRAAPADGDFWFRLVNSQVTGLANLSAVLGQDAAPVIRDWAISVYADDAAGSLARQYTQPSWNFRTLFPAAGAVFPLIDPPNERRLADAQATSLTMRGGGTAFLRFVVPAGREALVSVASGGQPPPASIRLAVLRLR